MKSETCNYCGAILPAPPDDGLCDHCGGEVEDTQADEPGWGMALAEVFES